MDHLVELPVGDHRIRLYAPQVFLDRKFFVTVREADIITIEAPPLGKLSVRAFPSNCRLSINGISAEALPILDIDIVAGVNRFAFKWPDGQKQEQNVEVKPGRHAYVTGQIR